VHAFQVEVFPRHLYTTTCPDAQLPFSALGAAVSGGALERLKIC
jgi:hypothetical protein